MITVVHVITRLELGGAQENTLETCRRLDRREHRVALLAGPGGLLDAEAQAIPDLTVIDVPELDRPVALARDLTSARKLRALLSDLWYEHRRQGFDPKRFVVHTHCSKAGLLGRLAARASGIPKVVHTIHGFPFHRDQGRATQAAYIQLERLASRACDAIIGVSQANLDEARALRIVLPRHRTVLIRSGMDLGPFLDPPARADARARLDVPSNAELIVCIANLKPQKDPLTMLEAIRLLRTRRPQVLLLYAGDGPLRASAQAFLRAAQLEPHVRLLGWRRDVPDLLAASDVVALASRFEGLPKAAVQAVAVGRPFVGTRVDGTPEIIRDGKNGFLVEPGDPEALAAALERALVERPVDPADRQRVGAWDVDRMVDAQAQLYRSLVSGPGG